MFFKVMLFDGMRVIFLCCNERLAFPFHILKQLINLSLQRNFFHFNGKYYKQTFGLSMGSPLSPILSNIYMELTEFYHILPHPLLNNSLRIRYVDDIFVSLPHNTNPNDVLNYINSIHPSVQYTIEIPSNNSIPFLDTLITWNNNHLQFTIYLSLIHISEPTRLLSISYAVFCLKK